jgi:hypothetical protein
MECWFGIAGYIDMMGIYFHLADKLLIEKTIFTVYNSTYNITVISLPCDIYEIKSGKFFISAIMFSTVILCNNYILFATIT